MSKATRRAPGKADRHCLSSQLRDIIASRGLTAYALGQQADVDPGVVSRFLNGVRDIRLETADRLGAALGLRLVEVATRKTPARARPRTDATGPRRSTRTGGAPDDRSSGPVIP